MLTSDFDYPLPPELIAQSPAPHREDSRLLVVERSANRIESGSRFADLGRWLRKGDLLVLNDTRVMPARLATFREDKPDIKVEILLLEELEPGRWSCLAGPGRRARPDDVLVFESNSGRTQTRARVAGKTDFGGRVLEFDAGADVRALMESCGSMPLPPYIHRDSALSSDRERYQTVFAKESGAVAAPTASLHFSAELLASLRSNDVRTTHLTLHVGLGTFRPVKTERTEDHIMHGERFRVPSECWSEVQAAKAEGRRVVAAGTTAVRALETFAALPDPEAERDRWLNSALFITPGFRFRILDALITNFHLPKSTLLMLVSAFAGADLVQRAYAQAIAEKYRFYSYGDAMLIL
ncbi:MAG: tRNA preQ1(34) S-adenosylmethionine ribosyltransferase-isomerase QueA [Verrucomicrobiae bacterium]|nr:tRNA preQ1(34) S-adenosylmethionine ribosyltransferase-isomerase QueA [Verrucomicrobiae bacterium]